MSSGFRFAPAGELLADAALLARHGLR